jgi:hypothetical protein
LEEITEADLTALIEVRTPELRTLEYKQALPGTSDDKRKEFLADASSFANCVGGHLIYGMREDAGVPVELVGVPENGDESIARLENMIRSGIAPRMAVHSCAIKLVNSQTAIVMRIPKSLAPPHMVTFGGTSRFYSRTSNGKYQLDVHEIRAAFLGPETTAESIRNFQFDRISRIRARETPIPLQQGPCTVLHILPLTAFGTSTRYDVTALKRNANMYLALAPLFQDNVNNSRINFDGLCMYDVAGKQPSGGFLQLYKTGIIETADTHLISAAEKYGKGKFIPSLAFEGRLFRSLRKYLPVLKSLGVDPPLMIMLSLTDVRGYTMATKDYAGFPDGGMPFDRDVLLPQEVLMDSYSADLTLVMKPLLDEVWNSVGFDGSVYYKDGKWVGDQLAAQVGGI